MPSNPKPQIKKSRLKLLHQYYSYTGFYAFLRTSMAKVLIPIVAFIAVLWLIHEFVIDFNVLFTTIINKYDPIIILGVFFASETMLGLVPPEIFIAWADKTASPIFYLTILASLSYIGGILSFFMGVF